MTSYCFDRMFHSKDSRNEQVSDLYNVRDWHIFEWKIPNLSLIPHEVDYAVQSPLFCFENASWIVKMYLYGQTQYHTEGHIDFIIERLNSQTSRHDILCKIYCKSACNEKFNHKNYSFGFDCQFPYSRIHNFLPSSTAAELNDSFTLVFEFGAPMLQPACEPDSKSVKPAIDKSILKDSTCIGKQDTLKRNPEIGEIFKCSAFKCLGWKLYSLPPTPPANYYAPSPPFSFANAVWILKILSHRKEHSSEINYHVVLERLHSEISEQNIVYKISTFPGEKKADGHFLINSSHTKKELLHFSMNFLGFHLNIEMKIKDANVETDIGIDSVSRSAGVLRNFKKLFLSQEDSDIIIKVKGQKFPAHRLVLKAQSPVFAAALRSDMQEKVTGIIDIEDCDPLTFSDFLCFLYCGEVRKLSVEKAFILFTVADKYNVSDLRSLCMEFIKLNLSIDTVCDTIALAMLYLDIKSELVELSTDYFVENFQAIIATDKWKNFVIQKPELSKELVSKAT